MLVNFVEDLPLIHEYIAGRVRAQSMLDQPVSAIEVGYQLDQAGLLLLHFDVREKHDRDGKWTLALGGPTLKLPHWQAAYELTEEQGVSFVLPEGSSFGFAAGITDGNVVASVFGEALLSIALDAIANQEFKPLKLLENCQLDIEEFDGRWAWPHSYEDVGQTNIIHKLTAMRLPR